MKQICPKGHASSDKVCLGCGHVFPLSLGTSLANGLTVKQCISNGEVNQYLVEKGNKSFQLWETKEFFKDHYRQQQLKEIQELNQAFWPPILDYWLDEQYQSSHLLYILQEHQPYQTSIQLNTLIEQNGLLPNEKIYSIILHLLKLIETFESNQLLFNAITSLHIYTNEQKVFLNLPIYSDIVNDENPTYLPLVNIGFSPPEQIRTGRLYQECDRFSLAMVLFHLLTGLSPVLWYPDVPSLLSYRYLWNDELVQFFEKLLLPVHTVPISELIVNWSAMKIVFKQTQKLSIINQEIMTFYKALEAYNHQNYSKSLDILLTIHQSELSNPHTDRLIGNILLKLGHVVDAVQAFRKADQRNPMGKTYLELGDLYLNEGEIAYAMGSYTRALELLPYIPEPYNKLGKLAMNRKRWQEARILFNRSLEIKATHTARDSLKQIAHQFEISPSYSGPGYTASYHKTQWKEHLKTSLTQSTCYKGHLNEGLPPTCYICHEPFHLQVGSTIKSYTIQEVLSTRTYSEEATNTYLVKSPAHKGTLFLKETTLNKPTRKKRYENEVLWLKQLSHPSIPECIEHFETEHHAYIIMPYYQGETLFDMLQNGNFLEEKYVRLFFFQILEILHYLQQQQQPIIHGDIKPQNLLWSEKKQRVMLMDFDNALYFKPGVENFCKQVTAEYAPPEQFIYSFVDLSSDLFALGTTCIKLLTGLTPRLFYYPHEQQYKKWDSFIDISYPFKALIYRLTVGFKRKYACVTDILPEVQQLQSSPPVPIQAEKKDFLNALHQFRRLEEPPQEIANKGQEILARKSNSHTYYIVGDKLARAKLHKQALTLFKLSGAADKYFIYSYWAASRIHTIDNNKAKAIEILENALKHCQNDYYTYFSLGRLYFEICWLKQAIAAYTKAIELHPFFIQALLELGNLHLQCDNFSGAQEQCSQVLNLQPHEAKAWLLQCLIYGRQHEYELAIKAGLKAIEMDNQNLEMRYNLGVSYFANQQYGDAIKQFKICLDLDPEHVHSQYFLGSASLEVGYLRQAKHYLEKARIANIEVELIDKKLNRLEQLQTAYNQLLAERSST